MINVKIIGAGSIGNHLANVCRDKNWDVTICDIDDAALERTKNDIYPSRYGKWDDSITLAKPADVAGKQYDLIIIGTPPDTHVALAKAELDSCPPKILLVEKPLCRPTDEDINIAKEFAAYPSTVLVAYNHSLAANTVFAEDLLKKNVIGKPVSLNVNWLENWNGIFGAHPWLAGPHDSYLGFWGRGGGSLCEHSHGVQIWLHFANLLGAGEIKNLSASIKMSNENGCDYDQYSKVLIKSQSGLVGSVALDVVTEPAEKSVTLQGEDGYIKWFANYKPGQDAVLWRNNNDEKESIHIIEKTRPDDFKNEINHIEKILDGSIKNSSISLNRGIEVMQLIKKAFQADAQSETIKGGL